MFFWKEVVNSSFTAPRRGLLANKLFNQERKRPQSWLAWEGNRAGWEARGDRPWPPTMEGPLPWAPPFEAISATPPHRSHWIPIRDLPPGPSLAFGGCFSFTSKWKLQQVCVKSALASLVALPIYLFFFSFFSLPFSCC